MNRWGKILVGAILVMSVMFMAASVAVFYTHQNWYQIIYRKPGEVKPGEELGLKAQLEEAKKRVDVLKKQYETIQNTVQIEELDRRARLAKSEREKAYLNAIYEEMVKELLALKESERSNLEGAQVAQEALAEKIKAIEQLRAETAQTVNERDAAFAESVGLTDKVHEREAELTRAKASTSMLHRQLAPAGNSPAKVARTAAQ